MREMRTLKLSSPEGCYRALTALQRVATVFTSMVKNIAFTLHPKGETHLSGCHIEGQKTGGR